MYRHGRSLLSLFASKSGTQSSLARRTLNECNKKEANFIERSLVRFYGGGHGAPGSDTPLGATQRPKTLHDAQGGLEYLKNGGFRSKSTMSGMNPSLMQSASQKGFDAGSYSKSMNFVRGAIAEDGEDGLGGHRLPQYYDAEQNADIVHIKIGRNNTFVTVTDNKGNKKCGASAGSLTGSRGGRYSADATAEHVGRLSRNLGLKSVVMKVNGFTHFKKKKQAILSWRDGFNQSRVGDQNPIVCIEDTTRRAHNGCRLPKRRRT